MAEHSRRRTAVDEVRDCHHHRTVRVPDTSSHGRAAGMDRFSSRTGAMGATARMRTTWLTIFAFFLLASATSFAQSDAAAIYQNGLALKKSQKLVEAAAAF